MFSKNVSQQDVAVQEISQKLISNLEDMIKQYRLLLDLVRKEKDILIAANIDEINDLNTQKETIILKIKALDTYRISCVEEIAQILTLPSESLRLLEISQRLGGINGDKLRTQHAALELIIKRLTEINKINAECANQALKNINGAMDNLKETITGKTTYQNKGKYQKSSDQAGHLVSKEA